MLTEQQRESLADAVLVLKRNRIINKVTDIKYQGVDNHRHIFKHKNGKKYVVDVFNNTFSVISDK